MLLVFLWLPVGFFAFSCFAGFSFRECVRMGSCVIAWVCFLWCSTFCRCDCYICWLFSRILVWLFDVGLCSVLAWPRCVSGVRGVAMGSPELWRHSFEIELVTMPSRPLAFRRALSFRSPILLQTPNEFVLYSFVASFVNDVLFPLNLPNAPSPL